MDGFRVKFARGVVMHPRLGSTAAAIMTMTSASFARMELLPVMMPPHTQYLGILLRVGSSSMLVNRMNLGLSGAERIRKLISLFVVPLYLRIPASFAQMVPL